MSEIVSAKGLAMFVWRTKQKLIKKTSESLKVSLKVRAERCVFDEGTVREDSLQLMFFVSCNVL